MSSASRDFCPQHSSYGVYLRDWCAVKVEEAQSIWVGWTLGHSRDRFGGHVESSIARS